MTVFTLVPNWLKFLLVALVAVGVVASGGYLLGSNDERQRTRAEQLQSDIKSERERTKDDAKLRSLSNYDFCVLSLRRRGLPVKKCDELRGVPGE